MSNRADVATVMTPASTHAAWPFVSIVIPARNEERYIRACLQAVLAQTYPPTLMEVIVVDGMSEDRTREIVQDVAQQDSRVRLLTSPRRYTPFSMNIGVAAATADVLVRIDAHSAVGQDHVRRCVAYLLESGADHIGGLMRAQGRTYGAKAIALAMSSPFGVGTARFRYTRQERDIDTVPFGAYRREILMRLGGFDERFIIGQDSELDYRITRNGGRVRVTPTISTDYYCRDSLKGLAVQFFRYGKAKVRILHKHGSLPSPRALAPATLIVVLAGLALAAPFSHTVAAIFALAICTYIAACLAAGIITAAAHGWRYAPLLPLAFMTLHLSHGSGFLWGLPIFFTPRPTDRMHGSLQAGMAEIAAGKGAGIAS